MAWNIEKHLHHLAVSDLLGHGRTGSTERVGKSCSRGSACTIEFCTFASKCWTGPGFRRNCRSKTAEQGGAWLCRVDYRNFLAVHLHRNPYLCSAAFYQMSCWTDFGRGTACCQNQWLSCPSQPTYSALVSVDCSTPSYHLPLHRWLAAALAPAYLFKLFCSVCLCLPFLQILLFLIINSLDHNVWMIKSKASNKLAKFHPKLTDCQFINRKSIKIGTSNLMLSHLWKEFEKLFR